MPSLRERLARLHQDPVKPIKCFRCPFCAKEFLSKYTKYCDLCGTSFLYANEQLTDITSEELAKEVAEQKLEQELINKIVVETTEALKGRPISPANFVRSFLQIYGHTRQVGAQNYFIPAYKRHPAYKGASLEEIVRYIVNRIPKDITKFGVVEQSGFIRESLNQRYDQYAIDYCTGSGWLPSYDYPISLVPRTPPLGNEWHDRVSYSVIIHHLREKEEKVEPYEMEPEDLCCFAIVSSDKDDIRPSQMENFWSSIQSFKYRVIFEIVGTEQNIVFQVLCDKEVKEQIAARLSSSFPSVQLRNEDYLRDFFQVFLNSVSEEFKKLSDEEREEYSSVERLYSLYDAFGFSLGLSKHYSYPLRTFTTFTPDPLTSLLTALGNFQKGEIGIIQVLVFPTENWVKHLKWVGESEKDEDYVMSKFKDCPVYEKLKYPLFAVCLKAASFGKKGITNAEKLEAFPNNVVDAFATFSSPNNNSITDKPANILFKDIPPNYREVGSTLEPHELRWMLDRDTFRYGFILNSLELANLCHFPSKALQHPKLLRQKTGEVEAPVEMTEGGLLIGINEIRDKEQPVYIPEKYRDRHAYIVGITGMGKTTLLTNMIKQDIDAGNGVGVIDIHGDLVRDHILPIIPEHRVEDVILFDPTDEGYPIGFNMLQIENESERDRIRDDIVLTIERVSETSWAEQMDYLLSETVAILLADKEKHTMLDAVRMILDDSYRFEVLQRIEDDFAKTFWRDVFPSMTEPTKMAVVRRLSDVFRDRKVRNIFAQKETAFSFRDIMDNRKIFLARIPRGALPSTHRLFGKVLVSKIQLTAMAREAIPEEGRVPFYLYIDEFQHFVGEAFEEILAEARKYRLCLTLSHQYTAQLPEKILKAVGIVGSLIVFRLELDDARAIAPQLGPFTVDDILNLDDYHTITKVGRARNAFSMRTLPPPRSETDLSEKIRQLSREKYCRKPVIEEPKRDEPKPTKPEFFE